MYIKKIIASLEKYRSKLDRENIWQNTHFEVIQFDANTQKYQEMPLLKSLSSGYLKADLLKFTAVSSPQLIDYLHFLGHVGHTHWSVTPSRIAHILSIEDHQSLFVEFLTCPSVQAYFQQVGYRCYPDKVRSSNTQIIENYEIDTELARLCERHTRRGIKTLVLDLCDRLFGQRWEEMIFLRTNASWSDILERNRPVLLGTTFLLADLTQGIFWLLILQETDA
jgi:hypothetical protein